MTNDFWTKLRSRRSIIGGAGKIGAVSVVAATFGLRSDGSAASGPCAQTSSMTPYDILMPEEFGDYKRHLIDDVHIEGERAILVSDRNRTHYNFYGRPFQIKGVQPNGQPITVHDNRKIEPVETLYLNESMLAGREVSISVVGRLTTVFPPKLKLERAGSHTAYDLEIIFADPPETNTGNKTILKFTDYKDKSPFKRIVVYNDAGRIIDDFEINGVDAVSPRMFNSPKIFNFPISQSPTDKANHLTIQWKETVTDRLNHVAKNCIYDPTLTDAQKLQARHVMAGRFQHELSCRPRGRSIGE